MLVISRTTDQGFQIADKIRVVVLGVSGGKVRIGIDAPKDVRILRDELVDLDEPPRPAPRAA